MGYEVVSVVAGGEEVSVVHGRYLLFSTAYQKYLVTFDPGAQVQIHEQRSHDTLVRVSKYCIEG